MHDDDQPMRFRPPRSSDIAGLIVAAGIMLAAAWLGIVPAVMPVRE